MPHDEGSLGGSFKHYSQKCASAKHNGAEGPPAGNFHPSRNGERRDEQVGVRPSPHPPPGGQNHVLDAIRGDVRPQGPRGRGVGGAGAQTTTRQAGRSRSSTLTPHPWLGHSPISPTIPSTPPKSKSEDSQQKSKQGGWSDTPPPEATPTPPPGSWLRPTRGVQEEYRGVEGWRQASPAGKMSVINKSNSASIMAKTLGTRANANLSRGGNKGGGHVTMRD